MSTRASHDADRLVLALEDLVAQEGLEARRGSVERIRLVQSRISPLVSALSNLCAECRDPSLRARLASLAEKRAESTRVMEAARDSLFSRIQTGKAALLRMRRISPAYGSGFHAASRLNASI